MRRSATINQTAGWRRWRFRDVRIWLAVGAVIALLIALWAVRAYQLRPLIFPPEAPTAAAQLAASPTHWPTARFDVGGTAWAPDADVPGALSAQWEIDTPGTVLGTPAVADGQVFVATDAGFAVALDSDSGETVWTHNLDSPSDSGPAVAGDLVYVGTRDHRVIALNRQTGTVRWEHDLGNIVLGSPIVSKGTLYIGSTNGELTALDAATGAFRWSADANGWVVSHPVTDGSVVAAASLGERFVTADPETGRRRLVFYSGTPVAGGPVMADGRAFFVTNLGGVWAVNPSAISRPFSRFAYVAKFNFFAWRLRSDPPRQTGALWVASAGGKVKYSPAYGRGNLLVVNEAGKVTAFNAADGSTLWETQLDGEIAADPVIAGDTLVLGTSDGALYGLDVDSGSLEWTDDMGNSPMSAAPSVSGGTLFVPTVNGKLTALQGN